MSHIADLIKVDNFQASGSPKSGLNLLKNRAFLGAAALVVAGGLAFATWQANATAAPPPAPAAVPVTVAAVDAKPVRIWSEFSGRMTAVDSAEVRPQVAGRITEIRFTNGQEVKAGDVLFVIDPRPFEAAVSKAQADLATAKANATFAAVDLQRAKALIGMQAIARTYYDQRVDSAGVANAAVQAAKAALTAAQLDVDHAYVKGPISGRVSRAEITVGHLLQ